MLSADRSACRITATPILPVSALRDLQQLVEVIGLADDPAISSGPRAKPRPAK
jgi:hypothetical protein